MEPFTLVMDIEGNDGTERGEDDTSFEKQSALFALAVSDIVLINMWCNDIVREHAANKPLLRIVFQAMIRLNMRRKTTLLFVIRDKTTMTPVKMMESKIKEDIQKVWEKVIKPEDWKMSLSDVFDVEVAFLSHYEHQLSTFMKEVESLRQRFCDSITPGGLAGDRGEVVPASGFAHSIQKIWKDIKENKDLDMPSHRHACAIVSCNAIAKETLDTITANTDWHNLQIDAQRGMVIGFGNKLSAILDKCLVGYDEESKYFDEGARSSRRDRLVKEDFPKIVRPAYDFIVGHIRSKALSDFKEAFDKALVKGKEGFANASVKCKQYYLSEFDKRVKQDAAIKYADWNPSEVKDNLAREMDAHVAPIRATKLIELTERYKTCLYDALARPVATSLEKADDGTWPEIRELFGRETTVCVQGLSSALSSEFGLDQATTDKITEELMDRARVIVEKEAEYAAKNVLAHMESRFKDVFNYDDKGIVREWKSKKEIKARSETATAACVKMLSVRAAVRLGDQPDNIEEILWFALSSDDSCILLNLKTWWNEFVKKVLIFIVLVMAFQFKNKHFGASTADGSSSFLNSNTWIEVPLVNTLLSPVECKDLLADFRKSAEPIVINAIEKVEEANKCKNMGYVHKALDILYRLGSFYFGQ